MGAGSKAEAFLEAAIASGWKAELRQDGDKTTVKAEADGKTLTISWRGSACLNETVYESNGQRRKLRNAAAARRQLEEGSPDGARTKLSNAKQEKPSDKATNNRRSKETKVVPAPPSRPAPRPPKRLPFDLNTAPDRKILEAVIGKRITWKNSQSGNYDSARVMSNPEQNYLRIQLTRAGERCITWAEADDKNPRMAGGGFRSVKLSSIVSITNK